MDSTSTTLTPAWIAPSPQIPWSILLALMKKASAPARQVLSGIWIPILVSAAMDSTSTTLTPAWIAPSQVTKISSLPKLPITLAANAIVQAAMLGTLPTTNASYVLTPNTGQEPNAPHVQLQRILWLINQMILHTLADSVLASPMLTGIRMLMNASVLMDATPMAMPAQNAAPSLPTTTP